MRKEQYKVVIVGFAHVHINDVAKHFYDHPRIDLCACADVPPRVPELKPGAIYTREWNIDYCCKNYNMKKYDDWKVMLDEEKPDLCVVNSENFYHVEITEECAKRGIGVSIEKPMATTMSDAMKMYRIIKTYNTFYMVNWPITWNAGLQTVKRMVDEGVIGDIIEIKTYRPPGPRCQAQDRRNLRAYDRGRKVLHLVAPDCFRRRCHGRLLLLRLHRQLLDGRRSRCCCYGYAGQLHARSG